MKKLTEKKLFADVLIIGGGTAGCYAALTIARNSDLNVIIAEKADIKRSGCLAAGVNALNAYITKGKTPQYYTDYAMNDAENIAREDLLFTMSEKLNSVTADLENMGLVILKDENGEYSTRGTRNIKINGENIKPILAGEVSKQSAINVINRLNITDLIVSDNKVLGAVGIKLDEDDFYVISAQTVIICTGGAAGLYAPNNKGFSRHKMWYPPFNTGAGYAMGLKNGAEMTSFEMRFIALRCKDTIAPTGTIAQGTGAKQVNSLGEIYEDKYGLTTSQRLYGTVMENLNGRGSCALQTSSLNKSIDDDLLKAYLNMAPSQTLKWIESGVKPSEQNTEICGTEPYIVGGHTASGFWVNTNRETTINGLYAAGDVSGGCPQKYVTGALAEGEICALDIIKKYLHDDKINILNDDIYELKKQQAEHYLNNPDTNFNTDNLEEAMQKIMDEYAGGISANYGFNSHTLKIALDRIIQLEKLAVNLHADDMQELVYIYELTERLIVCKAVIAHLEARKETRWHCFAENYDYPEKSDEWLKFVNSVMDEDGNIKILTRPIETGGRFYEHTN